VTFLTASDDATSLASTFTSEYPDLFQSTTLPTPTPTGNYSMRAPVQTSAGLLKLPGNLIGSICQEGVYVLFGVDRDVSCTSITPSV
jgi:hypothetical protein